MRSVRNIPRSYGPPISAISVAAEMTADRIEIRAAGCKAHRLSYTPEEKDAEQRRLEQSLPASELLRHLPDSVRK